MKYVQISIFFMNGKHFNIFFETESKSDLNLTTGLNAKCALK